MILPWVRLAVYAVAAGGLMYGGWQIRDWQATEADLERERAAADQMAAIQRGMDLAAAETEKRLAAARRDAAVARADAERMQQLANDTQRAAEQAGQHLDERGRVPARFLGEGAGLVGEVRGLLAEGEAISGRIAARHAGCAMTP